MDLATAFATDQVSDNDGCLEGALDSSLDATNIVTFGTQFVNNNEYIMIYWRMHLLQGTLVR